MTWIYTKTNIKYDVYAYKPKTTQVGGDLIDHCFYCEEDPFMWAHKQRVSLNQY